MAQKRPSGYAICLTGTIAGGAVGLAFIRFSPILAPVGAIVGAILGWMVAQRVEWSGTYRAVEFDLALAEISRGIGAALSGGCLHFLLTIVAGLAGLIALIH